MASYFVIQRAINFFCLCVEGEGDLLSFYMSSVSVIFFGLNGSAKVFSACYRLVNFLPMVNSHSIALYNCCLASDEKLSFAPVFIFFV